MSRLAAWLTLIFVVGVVAFASFGPATLSFGGQKQEPSGGLLGNGVVSAATVVIPYNPAGVIDQNSATPKPSSTPSTPPTPAPPVTRTVQFPPYNDASVVSSGEWSGDQNLGGWTDLAVGPHSGGT